MLYVAYSVLLDIHLFIHTVKAHEKLQEENPRKIITVVARRFLNEFVLIASWEENRF